MQGTDVFHMVIQMVAIGEESGSLDTMLGKVAILRSRGRRRGRGAFELDEPMIMGVLGTLIGGLVIACICRSSAGRVCEQTSARQVLTPVILEVVG